MENGHWRGPFSDVIEFELRNCWQSDSDTQRAPPIQAELFVFFELLLLNVDLQRQAVDSLLVFTK